jgi:hypothetical protein
LVNLIQGRGAGYFGKIQGYVVLGASIKLLFNLPVILIVPMLIAYLCLTYYVGYLDSTKLKIWQLEAETIALYNNPFNERQEEMYKMMKGNKNGRTKN